MKVRNIQGYVDIFLSALIFFLNNDLLIASNLITNRILVLFKLKIKYWLSILVKLN